ncbi:MAG: porphobilinogen synthase [Bacteroidetes bacterium]|nr:porphobilinogen synthase [Bacteroidota bacterium]
MIHRPRRLRRTASIRRGISETRLSPDQLIQPLFIAEGQDIKDEIKSLPGQFRLSVDMAIAFVKEALEFGIHQFILFPVIPEDRKDQWATFSHAANNFYLKSATEIHRVFGDKVTLISDVAMDPYSSDGHDGIVAEGEILNDETLEVLQRMSVAQARAGFDIIGPSDMMDGRVAAIRDALDNEGFSNMGNMSYTAKYASAFYGPFRDALDSAPKDGDKKTYQMDPANRREAFREANLDLEEGADYLMVKPAVHYMDIISDLKHNFPLPIVCYHVSGECAMLLAAAEKGWLDLNTAIPETLLALKRAGADLIISYFALDYARQIQNEKRL